MLVLGLAVRSTHQARPPERHKQQNRERFSPAVAALPPESLAARFDGRWSCGGCDTRCAGGCRCWCWRCYPQTTYRAPQTTPAAGRGPALSFCRSGLSSIYSHQFWLAETNRLRAARGAMRGRPNALWRQDSQDLSAQGPRGKHSFHQALTNYLSNDSPSCSDSSKCNLLDLGTCDLSRGITPRAKGERKKSEKRVKGERKQSERRAEGELKEREKRGRGE
jgi:hypothetical protein